MRLIEQTFTLTFGDQAENHAGMQKIGTPIDSGLTLEDMLNARKKFEGCRTELIALHDSAPRRAEATPAWLLIIRGGLNRVVSADELYKEQAALTKDTRALMYGRVVQKKARHNLCFADEAQAADYAAGKGTVVAFDDVPLTKRLRNELPTLFGAKAERLVAEGNYYYDPSVCGIGFHGDSERRIVIAARLGASLPLHYQWFQEGKAVGERVAVTIHHGDVYAMSDKAVGWDWKRRKEATLRHAAGAKKFLEI